MRHTGKRKTLAGSIQFDGAQSVSEMFSTMNNSLAVTADYGGGQTVQKEITLGAGSYAAANFSVQGDQIVYAAHPSSRSDNRSPSPPVGSADWVDTGG